MVLRNDKVKLIKASKDNVDILIEWTLDPIAQGPYKLVPDMTKDQLKEMFLNNPMREYYLITDIDNEPLGRFYHRKWFFNKEEKIVDWELNIIIAEPSKRGKGYGTSVQSLAVDLIRKQKNTNSIFAYTRVDNIGEQKVLEKCGFKFLGDMRNSYYKIDLGDLDPKDFVLYAIEPSY